MSTYKVDYELKSWPAFFGPIVAGQRTADIRNKADRDFRIGNVLRLREYDPWIGEYTGRHCVVKVTHVTSNVLPCALSSAVLHNDYAVLSLRLLSVGED